MSEQLPELSEGPLGEEKFHVMQRVVGNPSRPAKYRAITRPLHSYEAAVSWAEFEASQNPRRKGRYIIVSIRSADICL